LDQFAPDNDWLSVLEPLSYQPFWGRLQSFLLEERNSGHVFPANENVFRALKITPLSSVKVVVVGQDPYHDVDQADGLAFSVSGAVRKPPSLRNILKELESDIGVQAPESGDLTNWAKQGVLLLNTVLTVKEHAPGSHRGKGWELVTDQILSAVSNKDASSAFILWGKHAQEKRSLIDPTRHLIVESVHPSPLSARKGFFGSRPFSKVNDFLYDQGLGTVDWRLNND
jgi:uracil-DNA glycosylase